MSQNIADELILHKDLVEHQQKMIIHLEKKNETLRDLANTYKEDRDRWHGLFETLRTQHQKYIDRVNAGLDSLLV